MKKTILFGVCVLAVSAALMPALSAKETVKFTVNEAEKASIEKQIQQYQKQAKDITDKAEADIRQAQDKFDKVKAKSEATINNANTQIKKLRADAEQATEEFNKAKQEANATIEAANATIKKANEDLEKNIKALASLSEVQEDPQTNTDPKANKKK